MVENKQLRSWPSAVIRSRLQSAEWLGHWINEPDATGPSANTKSYGRLTGVIPFRGQQGTVVLLELRANLCAGEDLVRPPARPHPAA